MLSPELLVMVIKNLHESSPESLPALRVVSKQFDRIIVPIMYQHITLTPGLIQGLEDLQFTQDIRRYTRHVDIRETVDWKVANKLIRSMDKLESFTWLYRSTAFRSPAFAPVAETLRTEWPSARYRLVGVEDTTLRAYAMWQSYDLRGGDSRMMDPTEQASNLYGLDELD